MVKVSVSMQRVYYLIRYLNIYRSKEYRNCDLLLLLLPVVVVVVIVLLLLLLTAIEECRG